MSIYGMQGLLGQNPEFNTTQVPPPGGGGAGGRDPERYIS